MHRRLFNLAAAVSLVLGIATLAMLARCAWACDIFRWVGWDPGRRQYHAIELGWSQTSLQVFYERHDFDPDPYFDLLREIRLTRGWHRDGYHLQSFTPFSGGLKWPWVRMTHMPRREVLLQPLHHVERWTIWLQLWPILFASTILPALWLRRAIRARRSTSATLCPTCGYDLRATPDRCPECGTVASPAQHA